MPIAAQTKDVDPGLLELLKKEEGALVVEWGLLSQGSEMPPVKLCQCVIEVAPGGGERRGVCCVLEAARRHRNISPPRSRWCQAMSSGHSQVILRVMLTGHQEGQCIIDLEAYCGVWDAWIRG